MPVIKPPYSLQAAKGKFPVFLAGSIEMGVAEKWQQAMESAFSKNENAVP